MVRTMVLENLWIRLYVHDALHKFIDVRRIDENVFTAGKRHLCYVGSVN
jgi:hypothetical protein